MSINCQKMWYGILPTKSTKNAAGFDLYTPHTFVIHPNEILTIDIGIIFEIPPHHYGQIQSRSGLASKQGIISLGGVIDSDYRGVIKCIITNISNSNVNLCEKSKIAQIIILPCPNMVIKLVDKIDTDTERGENGFGSSG